MKIYTSDRDSIKKTKAQKEYIIPGPGCCLFVGPTASGKSNIITNLLKSKHMLKGYFDLIYLFCLSPSKTIVDNIDIDEDNIFTNDNPDNLTGILEVAKENIKNVGFKDSPHILIILDDCAQSKTLMQHKALSDIFFGGTHSKISTWIAVQNYRSLPQRLRRNAHSIILCHGCNSQEIEKFVVEFQSQFLSVNDFRDMVNHALKEPYSFLFANFANPNKKLAFRKGFDSILKIK